MLWLKVHSQGLLRPSVIRVLCQALEPTAFLVHPVLTAIAEEAVAAQSSAAWKLPGLCRRSRPILQLMIFVFPAFILSLFSSIASFQVKGGVLSLGEHWPSLQTLHYTPNQHGYSSAHWHTSTAPVAQSTPPHQVFSSPTDELLRHSIKPLLQVYESHVESLVGS